MLKPPPPELQAFWGTFTWADNPWFPDSNAATLSRRKYNRIEVTRIAIFLITRRGADFYTVQVPTAAEWKVGHTATKLQRWLLVVLLCSPRLKIGEQLGAPLQLRHQPDMSSHYEWKLPVSGAIEGTEQVQQAIIVLHQRAPMGSNGQSLTTTRRAMT
ncbi:hypothetical protein JG687_00018016 [Phytophthora cactorum]|uniref:Uncharacterized protein n=1 Tax=Phytophthora cactorum TaxID=29920 RepID=A0A8T1TNU8_9STRA|nr:hypothetical protein JG687_00018016 [Phytophthora cactorum]